MTARRKIDSRLAMFVLVASLTAFATMAAGEASVPQTSAVQGCQLCVPGEDCPIEGEVCCPHAPGFDVPFTCSSEQCFRGSGEVCNPQDECTIEGQVCCPLQPGPTPFTCDSGDCFR